MNAFGWVLASFPLFLLARGRFSAYFQLPDVESK